MSHQLGVVSTFSGVADPSLGYSGIFATGLHDTLCGCDLSSLGDYNFYIEPYYSDSNVATFYMPWGIPATGDYFYPVYGVSPPTTSSISTFSNYDFSALLNGLPIPTIGSNYTAPGVWYASGVDSLMAKASNSPIHIPNSLDNALKFFRTTFEGIDNPATSDPLISRVYIPFLPHSVNGQLNACPQSCFEVPYFAATNRSGHLGMRLSDSGVDLFPPLRTGLPSALVDLINPTFENGLIFYSYGEGPSGNKRYFSPNYFISGLSGQFASGYQNPIQFLIDDPSQYGLYPFGRFACKEPLILQHPIDTYTKIGGKAHYRAFALDWNGLPSDELNYQWFRTLKTQYDPVPIPHVIVNSLSNGANTPDLTVMEINLSGSISGVLFTNRGRYYSSPPTVSFGGGGATTATASINGNGEVTGISISNKEDVDWTMETDSLVGRSPSVTFSASPSGVDYTASGILLPDSGYNKQSILNSLGFTKEAVTRGIVAGFDDLFYYFCRISNNYVARDTQLASLTVETDLTFPLITSNRSYFDVSNGKVLFSGGNVNLTVDLAFHINGYAGMATGCNFHKDVPIVQHKINTKDCYDEPIFTGFIWPEQVSATMGSKNGDCWRGTNYSWFSAEGDVGPNGLFDKSGSADLYKVDYGDLEIVSSSPLTQSQGDLLYGVKALPICKDFQLIHSGVTVDVILYYTDGFSQSHVEGDPVCPGFLNDYTTALNNGAYCSLRHPTCYGSPSDVYFYPDSFSSSTHTLGCVGAFTSGEYVFCPGLSASPCENCSPTTGSLWSLFDGSFVAGTGCGFRNPVFKRKHYISVESKSVAGGGERYYGDITCCAGLFQSEGTFLKDAGIQYNWLTYPRDARLKWIDIPESNYGFKWEYDIHGRDKYNNGPPSNFLQEDFKTNVTLYDHISNFGLYRETGGYLLHPRPIYELGYDKNTCSGCDVADPCADKSNEEASYLTPILEVKGGPYRRAGHYGLDCGWKEPLKQCSHFSFHALLRRKDYVYVCCPYTGAGETGTYQSFYAEFSNIYLVNTHGVYTRASGSVEFMFNLGLGEPIFTFTNSGFGSGLCELADIKDLDVMWDVKGYEHTPTGYIVKDSDTYSGAPCTFAFDLMYSGDRVACTSGGDSYYDVEYILSDTAVIGNAIFDNEYAGDGTIQSGFCQGNYDVIYGDHVSSTGYITDAHCTSFILKDISANCFRDSCYPMHPIYVGSCIYNLYNGLSSGQGSDYVSGILASLYGYDLLTGNAIGNYLVVTNSLDAVSNALMYNGKWHTGENVEKLILPVVDRQVFLGFGESDNLGAWKRKVTYENYTGAASTEFVETSSVLLSYQQTYQYTQIEISYGSLICGSTFSGYTTGSFSPSPPISWYDTARRNNLPPHQGNDASFNVWPTGGPDTDPDFSGYLMGI